MSILATRVSLLGVGVHPIDLRETVDVIADSISKNEKGYICLAPAHNLMAGRADPGLRAVFNRSTLTVPDGMGTVWFLRLLGQRAERVYGPDLLLATIERGQQLAWRHFFLGGVPGVAERLVENLKAKFPALQVAGTYAPPFTDMQPKEQDEMIAKINSKRADVLWVGLGSPKQERWMVEFRPRLHAPIMLGVGAAFDFLSGHKAQAPAWMQRLGLEWLFRLAAEPRRLWRRYAAYPFFVVLALGQLLGFRRYPLEEHG